MRALITGIQGFVGPHLARHLLAQNDTVLGCARHASWPADADPQLCAAVPLVAWDLLSPIPAATRERMAVFAPDVIYHLAARSVPADCGGGEPTPVAWRLNVAAVAELVECVAHWSVRPRFLLASTSHVYATPAGPAETRVAEDAPCAPRNGYGQTKLAAERLVLDAVAAGRLDALVVRAFQHTGPGQSPRMMLPAWCEQIAREVPGPIRVVTLDSHLDLADVRDVVRAYRSLMIHGQGGGIYNVGVGVARRSGDIFTTLCALAGRPPLAQQSAPGPQWLPIADLCRLTAATGWQPEISLETTLADTLHYWRRRVGVAASRDE